MILRYDRLHRQPSVFLSLTGLRVAELDTLLAELGPRSQQAEQTRLTQPTPRRPRRHRAIGAGHPFALLPRDQVLLTVVWLRQYPAYAVLGYLFGVHASTVQRTIPRLLPVLEQAGQASMRAVLATMPTPERARRRSRRGLDDLLRDVPDLAVIIDTFEQRVQRPHGRQPNGKAAADAYYSGKKRQHTLKSQVAIDADTGQVVDVPESVPGPTNDLKLLEQSDLLGRLPPGVGGLGDLAYVGIAKLAPQVPTATPRRKPRGQPRPAEDIAFNTAFAGRRVTVEQTIGRMRRYHALTACDRHHRRAHTARVRAIAGLVNCQLAHRFLG